MGTASDNGRLSLIPLVNAVECPEYTQGGWLKACPLSRLAVFGAEDRELFAAYRGGQVDGVELRLWIIRMFLERELCELIPESSGARSHCAESAPWLHRSSWFHSFRSRMHRLSTT